MDLYVWIYMDFCADFYGCLRMELLRHIIIAIFVILCFPSFFLLFQIPNVFNLFMPMLSIILLPPSSHNADNKSLFQSAKCLPFSILHGFSTTHCLLMGLSALLYLSCFTCTCQCWFITKWLKIIGMNVKSLSLVSLYGQCRRACKPYPPPKKTIWKK